MTIIVVCNRTWSDPTLPIMGGPFAMLMPMGTLEESKHKPWTWILGAPLSFVKKAGVEFDPDARGVKAIQGDAQSGSALEVSSLAASPLLQCFTCPASRHWTP